MFLNLKNKKIAETIANQQARIANHPKTHREDSQERNSREHKEIKSHRQHQQHLTKKQPASTATNTIHANNNSFTNIHPHFKIKIKDLNERQSLENMSRSQEKIDSSRMQRVASAYRKIKRIDNNEQSSVLEEAEKSQERIKKAGGKPQKAAKKQIMNNLTKNYVCTTEADEYEYKILEKMNSGKSDILQQLLSPFFQLFSPKDTQESFKERSQSHRDFELKQSLDKNSKSMLRDHKKKSNQILIREEEQFRSSMQESAEKIMANFFGRLDRAREKVESLNNSKKFRYVESPSINAFQRLYEDIERFVSSLYSVCVKEFDSHFQKYQEIIAGILKQHESVKMKYGEIEEVLKLERQKSKMFQSLAINYQQKSLYSTIFLHQLSFGYDIDSHIRERLYEQAKKNGLISEESQYQFSETQLPKAHHRSGVELGTTSKNLYDNNENHFFGAELNVNKKTQVGKTMEG